MDHRELILGIPAPTRRALCAQADGPGLIQAGVHLGLVALFGVWIAFGWPLWWVLLLPQGVLLVFLFTGLHECIHRTAFQSDRLNDVVAGLCGFLVLVEPAHFRYFHLAHHRFTHDPARDPELSEPKPTTLAGYLVYLSGVPEWISRIRTLLGIAAFGPRADYVPDRARGRVRGRAVLYLALYGMMILVSVTLALDALVWGWAMPLLLGGPFLRGYLLAEHTRCPHVADMLDNTRTTLTNRAVRWLAWNMPYHTEHHCYPAVPFHKLPALHAMMRQDLRQTERGYTRFNRRYARDASSGRLEETRHASEPDLSL